MLPHRPNDSNAATSLYECRSCLNRITTKEHVGACPDCDGILTNIAVPRE